MNVVFSITDNYTAYCGVALCSLLENSKDVTVNVYIISDFISDVNMHLLQQQCGKYGATIHFKFLNQEQKTIIDNLTKKSKSHYHKSILYRLFISSLISEDEALYLDSDIIVVDKLSELGKIHPQQSLKAVADVVRLSDYHRLQLDHTSHIYFNSGVLYINLKYFRDNNIEEKLLSYLELHSESLWLTDQDTLNAVLKGTVGYLHPKWNCFTILFAKQSYLKNRVWYKDLRNIQEAISHPLIIHFVGQKPWQLGGFIPHRETWIKYYKMSLWNNHIKMDYPNGMKGRLRFYTKKVIKMFLPFIAKKYIADIY